MKDAGISLRLLSYFTIILPVFALVFCLVLSIIVDYEKATYTHCEVEEILPSISAVIGGFNPQKFIWSISIAIITGPRFIVVKLNKDYLLDHCSAKINSVKINYLLNVIEILSLMTLSFVPSSEIFVVHAFAFTLFIVTSLISMMLVTYYLKDIRKQRLKKTLVKLSLLCIILATYFYRRHNEMCEPYVYSMFALCEYMVVMCNMIWHASVMREFLAYEILVERRLEMNL